MINLRKKKKKKKKPGNQRDKSLKRSNTINININSWLVRYTYNEK